MVPWPIALLTLFYGAVATASAATLWKVVTGLDHHSPIWSVGWLMVAGGAMCGLPLLRPWGRTLAVWTSALLTLATLAIAGLLVGAGRPGLGLVISLSTGFHVLVIQYLRRPSVHAWFQQP